MKHVGIIANPVNNQVSKLGLLYGRQQKRVGIILLAHYVLLVIVAISSLAFANEAFNIEPPPLPPPPSPNLVIADAHASTQTFSQDQTFTDLPEMIGRQALIIVALLSIIVIGVAAAYSER